MSDIRYEHNLLSQLIELTGHLKECKTAELEMVIAKELEKHFNPPVLYKGDL